MSCQWKAWYLVLSFWFGQWVAGSLGVLLLVHPLVVSFRGGSSFKALDIALASLPAGVHAVRPLLPLARVLDHPHGLGDEVSGYLLVHLFL